MDVKGKSGYTASGYTRHKLMVRARAEAHRRLVKEFPEAFEAILREVEREYGLTPPPTRS